MDFRAPYKELLVEIALVKQHLFCQVYAYRRIATRFTASREPRYFNLKALNCCECFVEMVLNMIFGE